MTRFDRITFDPQITGGRACIRGMRITAANVVGQIAHGATVEEVPATAPAATPASDRWRSGRGKHRRGAPRPETPRAA